MVLEKLYYEHSGHVGVVGAIATVAVGLAAVAAVGFGYAHLVMWLSEIPAWWAFAVLFAAPLIYGAIPSLLAGYTGRLTKVRSESYMALLGLGLGVLAVIWSWLVWFQMKSGIWFIISDTDKDLVATITSLTDASSWRRYAVWTIEAIMIVGAALVCAVGPTVAEDNPFCETCRNWAKEIYTSPLLAPIAYPAQLKNQLDDGNYALLLALEQVSAEPRSGTCSRLRIAGCSQCESFFCLDVEVVNLSVSVDDEGKASLNEDVKKIVEALIIPTSLYEKLLKKFSSN